MLKKSFPTLIGLILASVAINCSAVLPPKYLGVKNFKQCLATQVINTFSAWCMPDKKPENCPTTSWEQLNSFTELDKLPDCSYNSNVATPSTEDKPTDK